MEGHKGTARESSGKKTSEKVKVFPCEINDHTFFELVDEVHGMWYKCVLCDIVNLINGINFTKDLCVEHLNAASHKKIVTIWRHVGNKSKRKERKWISEKITVTQIITQIQSSLKEFPPIKD